jgi:hypothetical protein
MRAFISVVFVLGAFFLAAQPDVRPRNAPPFKDRIFFGGGGGFGAGRNAFGERFSSIAINPMVGYMVTPRFSTGLGLNYQRMSFPDVGIRLNQYGVSPFAMYRFGNLFAFGEYSMISAPFFNDPTRRATFQRLPIGLGYSMPAGRNSAINVMALYDVIYDQRDRIFASPWVFRVFFTAGGGFGVF